MKTLKSDTVLLRALEPSDLDLLYRLENDESVWEISNTTTPYSKYVLKQYLENAHRDIYEVKQLRLVICLAGNEQPVGLVDLYDFEPKHRRAGLGIVIFDREQRNKGYAARALEMIAKYAFLHLRLHQLYANISEDNNVSIKLFEQQGYALAGTKQDWIHSEKGYKNELLYQLIHGKKS